MRLSDEFFSRRLTVSVFIPDDDEWSYSTLGLPPIVCTFQLIQDLTHSQISVISSTSGIGVCPSGKPPYSGDFRVGPNNLKAPEMINDPSITQIGMGNSKIGPMFS